MDLVRDRGASAFATRLRRLSERFDRECRALYAERDLPFEPRWFATVVALREYGPIPVGELGSLTGVSHAAASQVCGGLRQAGLVVAEPSKTFPRRTLLALTPAGHALAGRCDPLWRAMGDASAAMLEEHAPRLLAELDALEAALDQASVRERVGEYDPPPHRTEASRRRVR